eukprot:5436091-Pyramimonas_sp.AAC.1
MFRGAEEQLRYGCDEILDAKACDAPVRRELVVRGKRLGSLLGPPLWVHWCVLGIMGGPDNNALACGEHVAMSNKTWPREQCVRGGHSSTHVANGGAACEIVCTST